jgi:hypothetical protein
MLCERSAFANHAILGSCCLGVGQLSCAEIPERIAADNLNAIVATLCRPPVEKLLRCPAGVSPPNFRNIFIDTKIFIPLFLYELLHVISLCNENILC